MTTLTARSLRNLAPVLIIGGLLLGVAYLARDGIGVRPLLLAGAGAVGVALLARPWLAPTLLALTAMMVRREFGTGSAVALNAATLLPPLLAAVWLVRGIIARDLRRLGTPADRPWVLLLLALLASLAIGRATWDPAVPQPGNLLLVQLGQYAIFAVAALAYWLPGLTLRSVADLERLTWLVLYVGGALGLLRLLPATSPLVASLTTAVFYRPPFWVTLTGLAGGLLLFQPALSARRRLFLVAVSALALYQSTFHGRLSISEWAGVWIVLAMLIWLRFPRLRWPAAMTIPTLTVIGLLFPVVYEFAGGQERWLESGGSRLVLIARVVGVTLRNPLTGLGPASYRFYAAMQPLPYLNALWFHPQVNSHNNYVDILAYGGLLALSLFGWLCWRILRFGIAVRANVQTGFARAYANGMVAVWVSLLAIMLLADWLLPFVYNIGFSGFQASIVAWLFVGGLAVLRREEPAP